MGQHLRAYLGHTSIWLMGLFFLGCFALTVPHLNSGSVWLCLIIGAVLYFVSEYTTHRFVFHGAPSKHPFVLKLQKQLHYDHHEVPNDLNLLFLPFWYSFPQLFLLWWIVFWVTSSTVLATAFVAGAMGALLYYEWVHFVAHRTIKPLTAWGRWMKKYHLWHHYKSEHYWYGVTSPALDYVFGTCKGEKEVEMSPTARKLGQ